MDHETFELFDESNFDAYDRDRYAPVLREGLAQHGLPLEDVLFVEQDGGMWVFCRTGLFRASIEGMFKKRTEIGAFIPAAQLGSVGVEPASPHALRLLVLDRADKPIAKIEFSAEYTRDVHQLEPLKQAAQARCRHVYKTMLEVWGEAPPEYSADCPCGQGRASVSHLEDHIVEVEAAPGVPALTYDCPACGVSTSDFWSNDEAGRGGAPAGLAVHLMAEHGVRG